jgi:hypothetical protein
VEDALIPMEQELELEALIAGSNRKLFSGSSRRR